MSEHAGHEDRRPDYGLECGYDAGRLPPEET